MGNLVYRFDFWGKNTWTKITDDDIDIKTLCRSFGTEPFSPMFIKEARDGDLEARRPQNPF